MSKLLKMGRIGRSLDVAKKQLNTPDAAELEAVLNGRIKAEGGVEVESRRVVAEEESHYILIRGKHNINQYQSERKRVSQEKEDERETRDVIELESDDEDIVDALKRKLAREKREKGGMCLHWWLYYRSCVNTILFPHF